MGNKLAVTAAFAVSLRMTGAPGQAHVQRFYCECKWNSSLQPSSVCPTGATYNQGAVPRVCSVFASGRESQAGRFCRRGRGAGGAGPLPAGRSLFSPELWRWRRLMDAGSFGELQSVLSRKRLGASESPWRTEWKRSLLSWCKIPRDPCIVFSSYFGNLL